jgi:hypothetical protein
MTQSPWARIEAEAQGAFASFPLRAYSEFMPPPWVGIKPVAPARALGLCTAGVGDDLSLDIDEQEQAHVLVPGLARIADHLIAELGKLVRGEPHALSRTLLDGNPAWPADLAAAAQAGRLASDPLVLALPLALSRTQDDKGNTPWTLFGASHEGAAAPFWRSIGDGLDRWLSWCGARSPARILADADEVPPSLRPRLGAATEGALVTFRAFAELPDDVRAAYLAGRLTLYPTPASLVFFQHPGYLRLARELPHATQIPLLHLFPRVEESCAIRVPQSGWLDEQGGGGHRVVDRVARTHRWQRVPRDHGVDERFADKVTVALFSTDPDEIGLYDKPLARNAQIWTEDYRLLLDGPRADRAALERAARTVASGGRFGYRFLFPPMRAGRRELYWHLPVLARRDAATGRGQVYRDAPPLGYVSAGDGTSDLTLAPRLLARPAHVAAATGFPRDPGRARFTTSHNVKKLLDLRELLGAPLPPPLARALVHVARTTSLDAWLDGLGDVAPAVRAALGPDEDPGTPRTLEATATRAFEESVWRTIAELSAPGYSQKENADGIAVNRGRSGGPAARAAGVHVAERRDLERLGDELHARHRALIARHGMDGRAEVLDHVFAWQTDFAYPWMEGWARNLEGPRERNVVVVIPGRDRGAAIVMADHTDTAYMEDVYDADRGGDKLRAPAAGADDNCSATSALLHAADALLPLARAGELARDVWLVHLTGEEFPADSLGARALAQALVERSLHLTAADGSVRDVSDVRVDGIFVLDMVGHNTERDRDVFQIAPGEGSASARLAQRAHRATARWNRLIAERNRAPERHGQGRARRMPDGSAAPPPFAHLALHGEIRVEWEPRSSLYNTDGQVFSDVGVPVVLLMENYDISRTGYHDTLDTMANIDLDYAAALTAIAIEAVADAACAE